MYVNTCHTTITKCSSGVLDYQQVCLKSFKNLKLGIERDVFNNKNYISTRTNKSFEMDT